MCVATVDLYNMLLAFMCTYVGSVSGSASNGGHSDCQQSIHTGIEARVPG